MRLNIAPALFCTAWNLLRTEFFCVCTIIYNTIILKESPEIVNFNRLDSEKFKVFYRYLTVLSFFHKIYIDAETLELLICQKIGAAVICASKKMRGTVK